MEGAPVLEVVDSPLDAAGWHTKTALVSVLAGVDAETARSRLDAHGGRVRDAIAPGADA